MILKYAFIKRYLSCSDFEINLDNKYQFSIDRKGETLILHPSTDSIPEGFFSDNVNISCLIGGNGSGKTCLMSFLTSFGGGEIPRINYDADYTAVFYSNEKYYVLNVENHNCSLKSGVSVFSADEIIVKLEEDDINNIRMYKSYYLSSNNTNMIKSSLFGAENDFSVGNERRYKGLHNLMEILHFIRCVPFENDLEEICNDKKIRLVITDRWLSQLNLSRISAQVKHRENLTTEIKRLKRNLDDEAITLARLIILRIISSNPHKKDSIFGRGEGDTDSIKHDLLREIKIESLEQYVNYRGDFQCFKDGGILESASSELAHIISCFENEIHLDFSCSSAKNLKILGIILEYSLKNEIEADGYKYYFLPPFSTGQWKRVELACKINHITNERGCGEYINLFIDEPDADLHPEMQTKLISWMVSMMDGKSKHFNVLISSHNPLILSDFPRRRVIFIGDKLVSKEKSKTLGANVYDLYKNSFLVTNAISEFIKKKIESAIVNKNIDELSFLINEVSEPLIVHSLTSHLNKIMDAEKSDNLRLTSFIDGLTETEKEFLRRELNHE